MRPLDSLQGKLMSDQVGFLESDCFQRGFDAPYVKTLAILLRTFVQTQAFCCDARSGIRDADFAEESSHLAKANILQESSMLKPTEKFISVFQWQEKGYLSILDVTADFVGQIQPFVPQKARCFSQFPQMSF